MGRGDDVGVGLAVAGDVAAHGLLLHKLALALHRQVEHTLHIGVATHEGYIVDGDREVSAAEGVELLAHHLRVGVLVLVHAVVYLESAALDAYLVGDAVGVVVVVIVFVGVGAEVVCAALEDWGAEEVAVGAVGLLRGHGHLDVLVGDGLALDGGLAEVVHLHAPLQLLAGDGDGGAVGQLVVGVAGGVAGMLAPAVGSGGGFAHGVAHGGGTAEVEHLARATTAEEGGVACGTGLDNLPAHREEVGTELARRRVGLYHHTLQLVVHVRLSHSIHPVKTIHPVKPAIQQVRHRVLQRVLGEVAGHSHHIAYVVALQLEHQLEVVTEVVARKAEAEGQRRLVQSTADAPREAHLRLVPYAHAVQRSAAGNQAVVIDAHKTVAIEVVALLHHLQGKGATLWHANLEIAAGVRLHRRVGEAHQVAVEAEAGVAHRHRAVLEEHTAGEADRRDVVEVHPLGDATVQREGDGGRGRRGVVVAELGGLRGGGDGIFHTAAIGQAVEEVGTGAVGGSHLHRGAVVGTRGGDGDAGTAAAVLVVHAARDAAVGRARAGGDVAGADGVALTGVAHGDAVLPHGANLRVGLVVHPEAVGGGAEGGPGSGGVVVGPRLDEELVHPAVGHAPREAYIFGAHQMRALQAVKVAGVGVVGIFASIAHKRYIMAVAAFYIIPLFKLPCPHWWFQRSFAPFHAKFVLIVYAGIVQHIGIVKNDARVVRIVFRMVEYPVNRGLDAIG